MGSILVWISKNTGRIQTPQSQNKACIKSGLPQEKFCKLNNLSYPKFLVWRSKIKAETNEVKPNKILPFRVTRSEELPTNQIKLRMPNSVLLEFLSSLATAQLHALLKLLGVVA